MRWAMVDGPWGLSASQSIELDRKCTNNLLCNRLNTATSRTAHPPTLRSTHSQFGISNDEALYGCSIETYIGHIQATHRPLHLCCGMNWVSVPSSKRSTLTLRNPDLSRQAVRYRSRALMTALWYFGVRQAQRQSCHSWVSSLRLCWQQVSFSFS